MEVERHPTGEALGRAHSQSEQVGFLALLSAFVGFPIRFHFFKKGVCEKT